MTIISSTREQGSILVYALLVITFLSGLAAYLSAISSPIIFEMTDTQKLLQVDLLNDSARNIYSTAVCQKLNNIKYNLSTTTANTVLNKHKNIKFKKNNDTIYEFTLTSSSSTIAYPNVISTITDKIKFSKSSSPNRTFKFYVNIDKCPLF